MNRYLSVLALVLAACVACQAKEATTPQFTPIPMQEEIGDQNIAKSVSRQSTVDSRLLVFYQGDNAWKDLESNGGVINYLFGDLIDQNIARHRSGEGTVWYLSDRMGSVRGHADSQGGLLNKQRYGSFGEILDQTNPAAADRFAFTGREFDEETDLYYYRARYYDPEIGRFISEDPLGFGAGDINELRYMWGMLRFECWILWGCHPTLKPFPLARVLPQSVCKVMWPG